MFDAKIEDDRNNLCIFILVEQFFKEKHTTFLKTLASRFHLILSNQTPMLDKKSGPWIEYLHDLIEPETDLSRSNEYTTQLRQLNQFLHQSASKILKRPVNQDDMDRKQKSLQEKAAYVFRISREFKKLVARRHIDLVLVSSEYSYLSRPVVIEAKKQGLPVMNIEHGFFGSLSYPETYTSALRVKSAYISDYVIVNNQLEAEILKRRHEYDPTNELVCFLPLGTPLDNSKCDLPAKHKALQTLQLESSRPVLSLFTSWCEPHRVSQVFQHQFDEAQFLESIFSHLEKYGMSNALNVVVKLHPSIHIFQEYSTVDLIKELAQKNNIKNLLVAVDHLDKVVAASDLIICSTDSSILWEGFMAQRPVAVKPPSSWAKTRHLHSLCSTNEMASSDLLNYILNESDFVNFITRYRNAGERKAYQERSQRFRKKWDIRHETVTQKSESIANWISKHIPPNRNKMTHETFKKPNDSCSISPAQIYLTTKNLISTNEFEAAAWILEKLIAAFPQYAPAHFDLAMLCYLDGDLEKAQSLCHTALQICPDNKSYHKVLMELNFVAGCTLNETTHRLN